MLNTVYQKGDNNMTTVENVTPKKTRTRSSVKKAPTERVKNIENIVQQAKTQTLGVMIETQQSLENEVNQLNVEAQSSLKNFRQDLLNRFSIIQLQIKHSQHDLIELKNFIKNELTMVVDDLNQFSKELKIDVSKISLKHKDQLSETLKRSKGNMLQVWNKMYIKQ